MWLSMFAQYLCSVIDVFVIRAFLSIEVLVRRAFYISQFIGGVHNLSPEILWF
jgi:hypothetical protein